VNDDNIEARTQSHTILVQALDKYIDDVIAMNHGTKARDLPIIIKNRLATSIQANIEYHTAMAEANEKAGDIAMADFHKVKVEIYKTIMPK
jgi:hypothetical protein